MEGEEVFMKYISRNEKRIWIEYQTVYNPLCQKDSQQTHRVWLLDDILIDEKLK